MGESCDSNQKILHLKNWPKTVEFTLIQKHFLVTLASKEAFCIVVFPKEKAEMKKLKSWTIKGQILYAVLNNVSVCRP